MLQFIRQNFRWIAGGFLLTFFSSFGQTFFISASVAEWQAQFDLSHGQFGRLYMLATLASALCLPFVGRMVDQLPVHRTVVIVVPVLAAATLMAAYAPSILLLIVAIFLLRLFGQGMMTHIAMTATGRWFAQQRGRAISLVTLGHQGGEATLPLMFAGFTIAFGYRTAWVAGALALMFIGLPLARWAYRQPRTPHHEKSQARDLPSREVRSWTRREVLRHPVFYILLTGVLAPPFIGTTIFYHQDYLTALREWPPQLFASSLSLMALITLVFALVSGALIDRFRARALLPFFLLPLAAACVVLSVDGPSGLLFLVMTLLGISYGMSSTLFGALWPEVYGVDHLGAIRSVIVSVMVFATAAGPGLTGTLIDLGVALPVQFVWLGGYCLVAALAMGATAARI